MGLGIGISGPNGTTGGGGGSWIRNSDWMSIPSVSSGDEIVYGLYAIYEDMPNELIISLSGTGHTINWGDDTDQVTVNLVEYTKAYDYSVTSGNISVDKYGRNYKQVLVNITLSGTCSTMYLDRSDSEIKYNLGWLDIVGDSPTTAILGLNQRGATELERLWLVDSALTSYVYTSMPNLRVLDVVYGAVASISQAFFGVGDFRDNNGDAVNLNLTSVPTFVNIFNNAQITKIGNLDINSVTSFIAGFSEVSSLYEIGYVYIPSVTSLSSGFPNLPSLRNIGLITTGLGLTTIANMFINAYNVEDVELTECTNVTTTTNAFSQNRNLKRCILTNLTVGVSIINGKMSATALNSFMTALGAANGAQTLSISGNPGSLTCDTSIGTGKGYTVVTA